MIRDVEVAPKCLLRSLVKKGEKYGLKVALARSKHGKKEEEKRSSKRRR